MLLALGRHWFHTSADRVAELVPDPNDVHEMYAFIALEREYEDELYKKTSPATERADTLKQLMEEAERGADSPA
jgi:hypothetical protein